MPSPRRNPAPIIVMQAQAQRRKRARDRVTQPGFSHSPTSHTQTQVPLLPHTSMERRQPSSWLRQGKRAAAALLLLGCVASPSTAWAYLGPAAGSSTSASARSASSSSSRTVAGMCVEEEELGKCAGGRTGACVCVCDRGREALAGE